MGKIVISENISLDGLAAGERLFDWVGQIKGEAAKVLLDEALETEALLLGRRSYEFFAGRWPARSGEYADRLNSMPKSRLFGETSGRKPMRLAGVQTIGDGLAFLTYQRA
jgi:dihydrofolate reductase